MILSEKKIIKPRTNTRKRNDLNILHVGKKEEKITEQPVNVFATKSFSNSNIEMNKEKKK